MSPRSKEERADDILDCIERIESYVEDMDLQTFKADPRTVDAVSMNLQSIGEATVQLLRKHPEVATQHGAVK